MSLEIKITLTGVGEADMALQDMRNALARRGPMHARMAVRGQQFTQDYLRKLNRHDSAARLGAKPTGHLQKAAASVEAQSDDNEARVTIPRRTGLGRAFGDVVIRPGSGRTYLTIPAHQTTYGRSVRDFPEDTFKFAVIKSWRIFLAQVFVDGPYKGEVGYWLKREVKQKQDRTLLPSDTGYAGVARRAAVEYLVNRIENPNGPAGGRSSGMPSAFPT
ncbi:MAG: hypothetical protein MUC40_00060 [Akkermansiaceae bacterium]|jgi:hypothetical protein|nr:hypothetical protein [Akkermansiaceae bacterium]